MVYGMARNMFSAKITVVLWTILLYLAEKPKANNRTTKFFPIFSVVRFPNSECVADDLRSGTCLTHDECQKTGGVPLSLCASNLGRCCVYKTHCGGTVQYNNTHITNPSYPGYERGLGDDCLYAILIPKSVCHLRLSMIEFNLTQPKDTVCVEDRMETSKPFIPIICGFNKGQHMYINVGGDLQFAVNFHTSDSEELRVWNIKVSYIPCNSPIQPPVGCVQYVWGSSGIVRSFNYFDAVQYHQLGNSHNSKQKKYSNNSTKEEVRTFPKHDVTLVKIKPSNYTTLVKSHHHQLKKPSEAANSTEEVPRPFPKPSHLANQNYAICIRQEKGFCAIRWSADDVFEVSGDPSNPEAVVGEACQEDYILIPAFTFGLKGLGRYDRFCGTNLNLPCTTGNAPGTSIALPFLLRFITNDKDAFTNRGFQLKYKQIKC